MIYEGSLFSNDLYFLEKHIKFVYKKADIFLLFTN